MNDDFEDLRNLSQLHSETARIERLAHNIERIRESQGKMEVTLGKLTDAVARLALIEERQAAASTAIERLTQSLEKLDERLRSLEVTEPMQTKAAEWVQSALWALATAAAMFVAGKAGLF